MSRTWSSHRADVHGWVPLAGGAAIRFEAPSTGVIPHTFAEVRDGQGEHRLLLEVRHTVRVGDLLLVVDDVDPGGVRFRTAEVHHPRASVIGRLGAVLWRPPRRPPVRT